MTKVGILTFHYSNNYGGILQTYSLYKVILSMGYDVQIINYVPSTYNTNSIIENINISKKLFSNKSKNFNVINIYKKMQIINKNSKIITNKFNLFREKELKLSKQVDEKSLMTEIDKYEIIVAGSDQIWNPSQREKMVYFLQFGSEYNGRKVSYAADSTTDIIETDNVNRLKTALLDFDFISVRNAHSHKFVKSLVDKKVEIVLDPTLIYDFECDNSKIKLNQDYILTYVLGAEISGTHNEALKKIKEKYGDLPVYSIKIPTLKFDLPNYAEKVFFDLSPDEWLNMFRNAKFVYTDSFHGVLFSLKFHKPFLAYYSEFLRATRFIDLSSRFGIGKHIVESVEDITVKGSLSKIPNFSDIDNIIENQKRISLKYLQDALR